jgi:hypothetical protein
MQHAKKYHDAKYASNMQVLTILPYIACNMQNMQKKICTICKICKRHFQYAEYALPTRAAGVTVTSSQALLTRMNNLNTSPGESAYSCPQCKSGHVDATYA